MSSAIPVPACNHQTKVRQQSLGTYSKEKKKKWREGLLKQVGNYSWNKNDPIFSIIEQCNYFFKKELLYTAGMSPQGPSKLEAHKRL